ncbi:MAG: hypothetical protein QNJ31_07135 [Candidatus Caenarcaniphilales bacterium]|nr:hypothetical protein [Candidatus Caenarcaniphilales bacterium]
MDLHITHLYRKHMSLYGDRGNVQVLDFAARQFGLNSFVHDCSVGERIPQNTNIILLGGGQDNDQEHILKDLLSKRNELIDLISNGAIFLGVCGGYQLLGEYYESAVGNYLEGLKVLNLHTKKPKSSEKRIIGNLIAKSEKFGVLCGFENHAGRTYLSADLNPLAKVVQGAGNNGSDRTEGVFQSFGKGLIIGTYFHSFLQKNIKVADHLIHKSLNLNNKSMVREFILEDLNQSNSLKLKY